LVVKYTPGARMSRCLTIVASARQGAGFERRTHAASPDRVSAAFADPETKARHPAYRWSERVIYS